MANEPTPTPAGAIQIEDDEPHTPASVPPPAPAAPAEAPVVAAPAAEDEIDLTDPELAKDQQRISGLIAELSRKRAENRDLKTKASEADTLRQQVQANAPYVDFLRANPQLLTPRQPDQPRAPEPHEDPDAIEAAQLMDFYTADGKPDAQRGAKWLALQDKRAGRTAQQIIQPLQQTSATQQAQANYTALLSWKDDAGQPMVDKQALDGVWGHMISQPGGLQQLASREGALSAAAAAKGFAGFIGKRAPVPPPHPPLHSEAPGGLPPTRRAAMTESQEKIAQERGWNAEKFQKLTTGFVKGRPTLLEE